MLRRAIQIHKRWKYLPTLEALEQRYLLSFNEFPIPTPSRYPFGITAGPDGNVWFAEITGDKIARISPKGKIAEFPLPSSRSNPLGITSGLDGNLWFTEHGRNRIGKISPDGKILAELSIPTIDSYPNGITTGPDGNIWFTEGGLIRSGGLIPMEVSASSWYPPPRAI
jgi:virginiamycin B lyase